MRYGEGGTGQERDVSMHSGFGTMWRSYIIKNEIYLKNPPLRMETKLRHMSLTVCRVRAGPLDSGGLALLPQHEQVHGKPAQGAPMLAVLLGHPAVPRLASHIQALSPSPRFPGTAAPSQL